MAKLRKFLTALKRTQEILDAVDEVVDVDRMIAISNSQGPQGKIIKNLLMSMADLDGSDLSQLGVKQLPPSKTKNKSSKKSPKT
jgi:hypothetical protein